MAAADVAVEMRLYLGMIAVAFVGNILFGLLQPITRRATAALIQATAFTAVAMLASFRPNEVDGQAGMGVPLFFIPFFVASWIGLLISAKLRRTP